MSVSVTPCSVTLKCTRVGVGSVSSSKVQEMAFWMAGAPVSVSMLTELRYKTLHTASTAQSPAQRSTSLSLPCAMLVGGGHRHHPAAPATGTWVRFVLMETEDLVTQKFIRNLFWLTLILCAQSFRSQRISFPGSKCHICLGFFFSPV